MSNNRGDNRKNNRIIIITIIIILIVSVICGVIVGLEDADIDKNIKEVIWAIIGFYAFIIFIVVLFAALGYLKKKKAQTVFTGMKEENFQTKSNNTFESMFANKSVDSNEYILIRCKACKNKISKNAKTCPHCGEPVDFTEEELNRELQNTKREQKIINDDKAAETIIRIIIGIIITILGIKMMLGGTSKILNDEDDEDDSEMKTYTIKIYEDKN